MKSDVSDAQVYPPVTYLLHFLSDLISPIGDEEHRPLHHFPLQNKEAENSCDKKKET